VYFSNFEDQQLYQQAAGGVPKRITNESNHDQLRYADAVVDGARNRLITVREDHRQPDREAQNTIAAVAIDGNSETVLVSGNDFYSSPRVSPDGSQLAWLTWNHPNMPWDGCELWIADMAADGSLSNHRLIAGGLR